MEEAPGRHHPSCSTVPGGVQGSRASSPPCKGSVCPTATQPTPRRREPQCLAPSWHLCAHKRNCLWRANTWEWEIWRVAAGRNFNIWGKREIWLSDRKCISIEDHESAILLSCANGIQQNLICNEEIHFHFIGLTKSCCAQETSFCCVPNSNDSVQTCRQGKKISHIKIPYVPGIFCVFPQTFEEHNNKLLAFFFLWKAN